MGSGGPLVTWGLLGGTSSYTVKRWKLNDLTCCNAASTGLSGPPWQDGALPVAGTYVYEVTASNPGWTATGQAQFVQFKSPGQIATVAPSGTIAPTSPAVTSGVTGVTSGATAPPNSAISRILPPPPKILALNGITGSGASRLVPARAIALPTVVASGGFRPVAPRLITLAAVSGTGPVIVLNRTLPGITAAAIPVPRTIALAPIDAVGVKLIPAPRTVSLTGLHATGGYRVAASRVVSLPEISAAGVYP
jgi:hypothetical protein